MRTYIFFTSLFYFLLTNQLFAQAGNGHYQIDDQLSTQEIDEDVFLVTHSFPWPANSLVIRFSNGEILLIDSPYTGKATEKLVNWLTVGNVSNTRITAINTHFHMDNLGGNGYLQEIGAVIYGSNMTVELLEKRGLGNGMVEIFESMEDQTYREHWSTHSLVPPNTVYDILKGLTLEFGERNIEIFYPGGGHSPDNVVVYYPEKEILFGGCLIKSIESRGKGNTGDALEDEWAASVKKVQERFKDVRIVIPGHGPEGGSELIDHTIQIVQ